MASLKSNVAAPTLSVTCFSQQFFLTHPESGKYLIAYSGGLDSHVLLHLFAQMKAKNPSLAIRSVYIDHGLQAVSTDWAVHCQEVADSLGIEHKTISLQLRKMTGESHEAIARKFRYQALADCLQHNEALLTAHHQCDQVETVLLQLLRGSGLDGLAAMPEKQPFASGYHVRPLLPYRRAVLEGYAHRHNLEYITDPTNSDPRFDRNFLRNAVIPLLKQHWPALGSTLSRVARLQAEASELLASYVDNELKSLTGSKPHTLSAVAVNTLPVVKRKATIRQWIKNAGFRAPSEIQLQQILDNVFASARHASPLVHWQGAEVRRYRDDVYIMSPLPEVAALLHQLPMSWDLQKTIEIKHWGELHPEDLGALTGILLEHEISLTVRFRKGGERIRPAGRKHTLSLKNLLQEAKVPPWQRERLPLVYVNGLLICVPTVACISADDLLSYLQSSQ